MAFTNPTTPNLADFITFCQTQGVASAFLLASSDYYTWALNFAMDRAPYVPQIPGIEYSLACYNLGLHWLITHAPDATGLALSSLAWSNGLVTATPAVALGVALGASFPVQIVGCAPVGFNGSFTASAVSASTFVYALEANPGTATTLGLFNLAFFSGLRTQWNVLGLVPGVVQSTGDQGTNTSLVVPEFFKTMTLEQLDLIKTPWGRAYLAYAQKAGPTVFGVS